MFIDKMFECLLGIHSNLKKTTTKIIIIIGINNILI